MLPGNGRNKWEMGNWTNGQMGKWANGKLGNWALRQDFDKLSLTAQGKQNGKLELGNCNKEAGYEC
jgi:hypothetical protein